MLAVDSRLRKQPSQARSRLTVDAFLEAADRVLRRDGYEAASTNRLAQVAGFSVGSLYQYFDDKQAVVGTLIDRELRREARDLVVVLDGTRGCDTSEVLARIVSFLFERRVELAHLHRTLAHHVHDLSDESPLRYARRLQNPLAAGAIQRIGSSHLVRHGNDPLEPRLGIVCGLIQAVSHRHAVEAAPHVSGEVLADTLVRTLTRYLAASSAPGAEAVDLIARWRDEAGPDLQAGARGVPAREIRALLLRRAAPGVGGVEPDAIEPAVEVGAGVYDLVVDRAARPVEDPSREEPWAHFARIIEALPD